jgi:hypothetical protein
MPSSQAQRIIERLQAFAAIETEDNALNLHRILADLPRVPDSETVLPSIFGVMERYPEADLGSPGPLVHEAEAIKGYTKYLSESVSRRPSMLALWMINRVLNAIEPDGERLPWISALRSVAESPSCSEALRQEAVNFLMHQRGASAA